VRRFLTTAALVGLLLSIAQAVAGGALAQARVTAVQLAQAGPPIGEVRVVGTQRIEPATVLSYMQVKPGDPYDAELVDQSLKSLFKTGLFADVTLRREGNTLVVQVVENPIINRIAFEGNDKLDDPTLESEVTLRPRVVYTRTRVQSDVRRILDLYRRSGRFAATVNPQVIQLEQNRVDLVFEINEGPLTGIRAINFIGNRIFSDKSLRGVVQTTESAWWRILTSDDTYDPDRLTFDRELLRRFYLAEGYADFRVVSAVAELTPDREDFIITFTVEEGQRYTFATIDVVSELKDLEPEQLRSLVLTEEGDWYNADQIEATVQTLSDTVGSFGYAFVEVRPRVRRDRDALTISVTYEVREGPRVYIERIDIVGNVRTVDTVIRREFLLVEGDAFDSARVRRSRSRLQNLDFFKSVQITNVPGSAPDRTVVEVEVQEKSTGELSLGAGFSTSAGFLGDLTLSERNLLGKGQNLRVGISLGQRRQQFDISFTEPYFLDKDLSAGVDAFRRQVDMQEESSFDTNDTGGSLRLGYQITPPLRHNIRYSLIRREVEQVNEDASIVIQQQKGTTTTSSISNGFYYNRLNARFNPTDGYFVRFDNDLAGLGGSVNYVKNTVGGGYFMPLFFPQVTGGVTAEYGNITGINEDVRIIDRYRLGGDKLRGFENGGVGPRDLSTDDALGGNQFYLGTAEVTFPLGLPEELGILGAAFTDIGSLWDINESGPLIVSEHQIRAAVGVGVSWRSPFGPVRVNLSEPIVKEDFDKEQRFQFNFGTRF